MKEKINQVIINLKEAALFKKTANDSFIIRDITAYFSPRNRIKEFNAYAEYYDIKIRLGYPSYAEARRVWLNNNSILRAPDPTIEQIREICYNLFLFLLILYTCYLTIKFFKFCKNINLYSHKSKYITQINFFKLALEEKRDSIQVLELNGNYLFCQKICNLLDGLVEKRFYEFKNMKDFSSVIDELYNLQKGLNENLDYDLFKEILALVDSFYKIVKNNNGRRIFWFI